LTLGGILIAFSPRPKGGREETMRVRTLGLGLLAAMTLVLPTSAQARQGAPSGKVALKKTLVLQYTGRLQDEQKKAIGGIYRLTFGLMANARAKKPTWTESHWAAVDNGAYTVELGRRRPLPKTLDMSQAAMSVSVPGVGEILREGLGGREGPLALVEAQVTPPGGKRIVDFAEKAGFATEAEHALNADRLGGMTAEELKKKLDEAAKKSGGSGGGATAKLGANRTNSAQAGGTGGTPTDLMCPKGAVVVGIKVNAGLYVDALQIICAPIE